MRPSTTNNPVVTSRDSSESTAPATSDLADRERDFYDIKGAGVYRRLRRLIWRAIGEFNRDHELHDLYDPAGKAVLVYGCGEGNEAQSLLRRGAASLRGFDISEAEISRARANAVAGGYAERVEFQTADAHHTPYADSSVDLIVGNAILHHLDLDPALSEIRRILRHGGKAVFREPLAHNPILRLGRAVTPAARTPDEHPFTVADWSECRRHFPSFTHREVELLSILFIPINLLLPRRLQRALARRVAALDDRIVARWPALGRYARTSLIVLQ
jgi:SAM-dependent methyltransferase